MDGKRWCVGVLDAKVLHSSCMQRFTEIEPDDVVRTPAACGIPTLQEEHDAERLCLHRACDPYQAKSRCITDAFAVTSS